MYSVRLAGERVFPSIRIIHSGGLRLAINKQETLILLGNSIPILPLTFANGGTRHSFSLSHFSILLFVFFSFLSFTLLPLLVALFPSLPLVVTTHTSIGVDLALATQPLHFPPPLGGVSVVQQIHFDFFFLMLLASPPEIRHPERGARHSSFALRQAMTDA